jgi:hypothetical protein
MLPTGRRQVGPDRALAPLPERHLRGVAVDGPDAGHGQSRQIGQARY